MISLSENFKPKFNVYLLIYLFIYLFIYTSSNFLVLIILQSETVKLNVSKHYMLEDVVGVLALA